MGAGAALILSLLDAAVGTAVFVRGGEWSRIEHALECLGRVDVADLWAVWSACTVFWQGDG